MTMQKAVRRSVLTCPNIGGKQPGPKQLIGRMKLQWFTQCSSEHETMRKLDKAIILLRSMPFKIFEADIEKQDVKKVPGWTVFHATVSVKGYASKTNIGYCPMIPPTATRLQCNILYDEILSASFPVSWPRVDICYL